MGAKGSAPWNEALCCNIRSNKAFVRSEGFGWIDGIIWAMNVADTAENKPAYNLGRDQVDEDHRA